MESIEESGGFVDTNFHKWAYWRKPSRKERKSGVWTERMTRPVMLGSEEVPETEEEHPRKKELCVKGVLY
ncbi:hypothetical protein GLYMA_04G237700v4 [Glycine max]|uniref:Uncharacterized protein n=1 Tax=Glycine max TaxID=3847 RepID=A0A0R0KCG8_SOYBN|nr:hypothetical protein JHK87_011045 [Glycine soja]KAG5050379.1 hypothetical protein JHK85_011482 [Glycine max]KAH1112919.1 hypothetical protein GYH30_010903 [Glycine max]KRH64497.1 hypothetical protein GLYMA_04G237700v4 [Glycine max]